MRGLLAAIPLLALLAACGDGTLRDLFGIFPPEAFEPEPGDPGTPPPGGPFEPEEIFFFDDAQGVTGTVTDLAVAQVGAQTLAFAAAGPDGIHVVDVTNPANLSDELFRGTVPPSALSGARADALGVVDGTHLVSVAVAAADMDGNAVTVFSIAALAGILNTPPPHVVAPAIVPRTGTDVIAVPGTAEGKAGGVSGAANSFLVATGGPLLATAAITPGTPGMWTAGPTVSSDADPDVDAWLHVLVNGTNAYASVRSQNQYGIVALALVPAPMFSTTAPLTVSGSFARFATDPVAGPGTFPLDLALDGTVLFVSADDRVDLYSVISPTVPTPLPGAVADTGEDTVAIDARGSALAVAAGSEVAVYRPLGSGFSEVARLDYAAPAVVRDVALLASATGRFVLAAAGSRGLRVIQWSNTP